MDVSANVDPQLHALVLAVKMVEVQAQGCGGGGGVAAGELNERLAERLRAVADRLSEPRGALRRSLVDDDRYVDVDVFDAVSGGPPLDTPALAPSKGSETAPSLSTAPPESSAGSASVPITESSPKGSPESSPELGLVHPTASWSSTRLASAMEVAKRDSLTAVPQPQPYRAPLRESSTRSTRLNKFNDVRQKNDAKKRVRWMLRQSDPARIAWDMFMTVLLLYIAIMLPYNVGFEKGVETVFDRILNYLFLCDVVLNFRTGFTDIEGVEVLDGPRVAKNYLRTWFGLDFLSSLPIHDMLWLYTASFATKSLAIPNLQPAKLLKIGKIAKVFKVIKIGNLLGSFGENSDFVDAVEEMLVSSDFLGLMKFIYLIVLTAFVAHWLACGMGIFSDDVEAGFLGAGASQAVGESPFDRYICAVYWAITTTATVGYGDFVPTSNVERCYAMFAMIVGATFYGYMIGVITSQVAEGDAHAKAYYEKMKKISAYCDHQEFPRHLRRRVRRYFKRRFSDKSALDDKAIMEDLSQELRSMVTEFLIHPYVRNHMMFESLPPPVISKLVHVLERNTYQQGDKIAAAGEHGTAMYVLVEGQATLSAADTVRTLRPGDSFGEAIILGLTKWSHCTVRADTACAFYEVPYQEFRVAFQATPDVVETMRDQMRAQSGSVLVQNGLGGLLGAPQQRMYF